MRDDSVDAARAPTPDEVRAELERVLASEPFRPSAQLRVFLRFVVESTLAGEADRIRAFTIAVEAFGREKDFNPQSDPIVRVEAARLRRAMEQYYAGPGADSAVVISVPRGAYVPQFRYRAASPEALPAALIPAAVEPSVPPSRPAPLGRYGIALAALLLLVGIGLVGARSLRDAGPTLAPQTTASMEPQRAAARPRSPLPVVSIEPVQDLEGGVFGRELAAIRHKLTDALARFDDIEVVTDRLPAAALEPGAPSAYRLTVIGERHADGATSPTVQLIDASGGTVVWARTFERLRAEDDLAEMTETIASQVAPALAQPFGVIYARELLSQRPGVDERYRCLLEAIEFRRTLDISQHPRVRACLERIIATEPAFPSAQAALAFLTLREFYAGESRDPRILDEGLRLAMRAVELRPGSARAHHVLMNILFARGDVASGLAEGERAVALNPYDMTAFVGYGLRLAFADRGAEGLKMLDRAAKLSPVRPPVLEFALFVVTYMLGDDARAAHHASLLVGDIHPLVLIARALAAVRNGEPARAQQAVDRLFSLYPAWRVGPRREIERYVPASNVVDRIMVDLAPLGFSTTN